MRAVAQLRNNAVIPTARNEMEHELYTDADADRPKEICDRNGQVTLWLCKRCGKGEAQLLDAPCTPLADLSNIEARAFPALTISPEEAAALRVSNTNTGRAPVTAPHVLEAAAAHMRDRAATYDKPEGERSMAATVAAFNAQTGRDLTEAEGWLLMVNLKIVRDRQSAPHRDSLEDLVAYSALMAEARLK